MNYGGIICVLNMYIFQIIFWCNSLMRQLRWESVLKCVGKLSLYFDYDNNACTSISRRSLRWINSHVIIRMETCNTINYKYPLNPSL